MHPAIVCKLRSLLRLAVIVGLAVVIPRIFVTYEQYKHPTDEQATPQFLTGIDNFIRNREDFSWLAGYKIGIIQTKPGWSGESGNTTAQALSNVGLDIRCVIATQEKIRSTLEIQAPSIDAFICDLQHTGLGGDETIETIHEALKVAQEHGKQVIVLDRPNPLGGKIEGPGIIPFRCGVTVGELASYLNTHILKKPAQLSVIPMIGWKRSASWLERKPDSPAPSEALPLVSFVTPFAHVKPLQVFPPASGSEPEFSLLLPQAKMLSAWELQHLSMLCTKSGISCSRLQTGPTRGIHFKKIPNPEEFAMFSTFLKLMRFFINRRNITISFTDQFDKLMGEEIVRNYFLGKASFTQLKTAVESSQVNFMEKIQPHLLYTPQPIPAPLKDVATRA
jgi:hypothetical protein